MMEVSVKAFWIVLRNFGARNAQDAYPTRDTFSANRLANTVALEDGMHA